MYRKRSIPRDWHDPAGGETQQAHPIRTLQDRVNSVLEQFWEKIGKHHTAISGRAYSGEPLFTDLSASPEEWRLEIETPGMDEDDLEVLVDEGQLTIRGEKRLERDESGRDYHLAERAYGRFTRSFELPEDVMAQRAKASYRNGVLTVTMPWKAGAKSKAKRIPISAK